jgi:hypothetical protein
MRFYIYISRSVSHSFGVHPTFPFDSNRTGFWYDSLSKRNLKLLNEFITLAKSDPSVTKLESPDSELVLEIDL